MWPRTDHVLVSSYHLPQFLNSIPQYHQADTLLNKPKVVLLYQKETKFLKLSHCEVIFVYPFTCPKL